ncbi:hypothetical protein TELCIR_01790 [Teladorsagia circumcincta]|uniref:Uncharacterized protein n=1 Tax=Teladorsagia circumcincta TaxID=45464 RepID=A0A2G9V2G1_TELCI|nr:hypothetical protein TELCIR_01790 [Teladorsagia circumcincta]
MNGGGPNQRAGENESVPMRTSSPYSEPQYERYADVDDEDDVDGAVTFFLLGTPAIIIIVATLLLFAGFWIEKRKREKRLQIYLKELEDELNEDIEASEVKNMESKNEAKSMEKSADVEKPREGKEKSSSIERATQAVARKVPSFKDKLQSAFGAAYNSKEKITKSKSNRKSGEIVSTSKESATATASKEAISKSRQQQPKEKTPKRPNKIKKGKKREKDKKRKRKRAR